VSINDDERTRREIWQWTWHAWIEVMDDMHLFNTRANTNKNKSAENG
jgi:hypothetical protein